MGQLENGRRVNVRDYRLGLVPAGHIVMGLSETSQDSETAQGLQRATHELKKSGVIFLDYHRTFTDIVVTAGQLLEKCPVTKILAPVTAKHERTRIKGRLLDAMRSMPGVELATVYRKEDTALSDEEFAKKFKVTRSHAENLNHAYEVASAQSTARPGHALILAPFGTRRRNLTSDTPLIRHGVADLLKTGTPAFCTYVHRRKLYITGSPLTFDAESKREDMTQQIEQEYERLQMIATHTPKHTYDPLL